MAKEYTVVTRLVANTKDFVSNMNKASQKTSKFANDFKTETDQINKRAGLIGSSFKKAFAVVGGAVATGALTAFGKSAIEAGANAQAMEAQFEQVFGNLQGQAQKAVDGLANEFGMTSNRIKPHMSMMTSMFKGLGLDTEEAMAQASKAVTMAADASAFYDMSFEEANASLNSFIKGNYEGGEAIGLFANETQMASWASENLGSDWQNLDEKGKQVARLQFAQAMQESAGATGQASREADTYQNQLGNLKQIWEDTKAKLAEPFLDTVIDGFKRLSGWLTNIDVTKISSGFQSVGSYLRDIFMPVFDDLKTAFSGLMTVLENTGALDLAKTAFDGIKTSLQWLRDNTGVITGLVLGLGGAFATFKVLTMISTAIGVFNTLLMALRTGTLMATVAQWGLNTALLANPFTWIAVAVGALIAVVVALWKNWDSVSQFFVNSWNWIKEQATVIWTALKLFFQLTWDAIKTTIMTVWNGIKTFLSTLWNGIKALALLVWDGIKAYFTTVFNVYKTIIMTVWNAIKAFLSGVWNGIKAVATAVFSALQTFFQNTWNSIKSVATAVWNGLKSFLSASWNSIKSVATNIFNALKSFFGNIWNGIKSIFNTVISAVVDFVKSRFNTMKSTISSIFNAVKSLISNVWNGIKSVFNTVVGAIVNFVKSKFNSLKSSISSIFNSIKSVASSVWNGIKSTVVNIATSIWSGVKGKFNSLKSSVSSIFNSIRSTASSIFNKVKSAITKPVETAKNTVKKAIDSIKGFFAGLKGKLKIKIPKPRLPRFSLKGKFSLKPPSVPKVGISWNAQGGIFNKPTIFNTANAGLQGVGEAGSEAIIPLKDSVLGKIGSMIARTMDYNVSDTLNAFMREFNPTKVAGAMSSNNIPMVNTGNTETINNNENIAIHNQFTFNVDGEMSKKKMDEIANYVASQQVKGIKKMGR